ncbi:DUF3888 domain-containing protein [Lottiidibacillus patelloidae]|nr:DUF3888 domain-containing protein [Lottiidibacillus patelloidae]
MEENQANIKEKVPIYYTPEDVLIALLSPKLHEIVKEHYGKKTTVEVYNIVDISLIHSTTTTLGGWFEIELMLRVGELENTTYDIVTLKITAPNTRPENRKTIREVNDIKVDLVEYKKIKRKND